MSTVSYDTPERDWDPEEPAEPLRRRPRRQFFNRKSAALVALITCAAGFYAGVRVEKGQVSGSSTALRLPGAAAAGAAGASSGRASGTPTAAGSAAGGARSGARTGGFAGAAGAFAGGNASVGSVASVNGRTLVLTETSGNTVKVQLSRSTKITKNQSVSRKAVRPGDTIIVQGAANSKGTTVAATVTDSGASSTGSGAGSSSSAGSSSGTGGSSAGGGVGSLFSSGG